MHLFEITTSDHDTLSVFATDYDEAAALFMLRHGTHRDAALPDFEVKRRNARWPGLNGEHLQAALARETSGVASYDPRTGWSIMMPTDRWEG